MIDQNALMIAAGGGYVAFMVANGQGLAGAQELGVGAALGALASKMGYLDYEIGKDPVSNAMECAVGGAVGGAAASVYLGQPPLIMAAGIGGAAVGATSYAVYYFMGSK